MAEILIIKLGAKGDVVRTLPVLLAIKEKYPESKITWMTKPASKEMLSIVPEINKILTTPCEIKDKFDILYSFDIEEEATKLSNSIKSDKKYGFYFNNGYASTFNFPAEYYLNTLFDDDLKKSNRKTYQQMIFEVAELPYKKQQYFIHLTEKDKEYAERFVKGNNINIKKLVGIHIGSSPRWPSKVWSEKRIIEFIKKAKEKGYEILLFSGPDDKERHDRLISRLSKIKVYQSNPENSDKEFFSLVNLCKAVICSDSYIMHIALSLKKPAIALFFCTSPHEVEDYGLLKKIVSPMLEKFFPEKSDQYDKELVNSISAEEVLKEVENIIK